MYYDKQFQEIEAKYEASPRRGLPSVPLLLVTEEKQFQDQENNIEQDTRKLSVDIM